MTISMTTSALAGQPGRTVPPLVITSMTPTVDVYGSDQATPRQPVPEPPERLLDRRSRPGQGAGHWRSRNLHFLGRDILYCSHGHPGERCVSSGFPGIIVQAAPGKLSCDSRPGAHPSTIAAAPPSPVSTAASLTGDCRMGIRVGARHHERGNRAVPVRRCTEQHRELIGWRWHAGLPAHAHQRLGIYRRGDRIRGGVLRLSGHRDGLRPGAGQRLHHAGPVPGVDGHREPRCAGTATIPTGWLRQRISRSVPRPASSSPGITSSRGSTRQSPVQSPDWRGLPRPATGTTNVPQPGSIRT